MVDDAFLKSWVETLRAEEPDALAVLVTGSYARGTPEPHSDLDLLVLTRGEPVVAYRARLVEFLDGHLLHVSIGSERWENWLAQETEPADWSWYLPAVEVARVLWCAPEVEERLRRPAIERPPGGMELEDFLECAGKVKNAHRRGNELALRLAAQGLAERCPSVLRPLNPIQRPGTRYEALRAALDLPEAPPGYRDDMLLCLGLTGQPNTIDDVYAASLRLAQGALVLLRPHAPSLTPELEPDLGAYLADDSLQRYLAQL